MKRFEEIYSQGALRQMKIIVDTQTGVQYLVVKEGYSGGITPLLNRDGKPLIAPTGRTEE